MKRRSGFCAAWQGVAFAWLLTAVGSGCNSVPTTPASALPAALRAAAPRSPHRLDLSRLSSPTTANDLLQPGDQLRLTVATGVPEADIEDHPVRVDQRGAAHLPLLGPVQLAGLRIPEAEQTVQLESIRRGIYRQPQIALSLESRKMHRIAVAGAVGKPGVKEIPAGSADLFTALSEAGALSLDADTVVEVTYPPQTGDQQGSVTIQVDLIRASEEGGTFPLPDGSAVMVRQQTPKSIHVDGLVKTPKRIDLPFDKELRLLEAISEAGGRRLQMADKIYVSRIDPATGRTRVIEASFRRAQQDASENLVLASGDVVNVQETPSTFTLETLRGFFRFGFSSALPGF